MNENRLLEGTLHYILRLINPLEADRSQRFEVIQGLRDIVQNIRTLKGAIVEPYGSFVSDLFTKWGDIDVCIELGNACAATKKEKISLLRDVLKELRRRGGYDGFNLISTARVPILMCHGKHNISCDISINTIDGKIKSKILYWISSIDARFRDMVLLVKEWAKTHNINNSKRATLNSYSLCLLVIFHFQRCVPPILPPLKEIYPGNVMDDIKEARIEQKNIQELCSYNINRFIHNVYRAHNQSSLSALFTSFIAGLCDISSRAAKQGINTYAGRWEDIESNMRWLPNKYPLIIEDPFEQPMNAARVVSKKQLPRIAQTFNRTYDVLVSPYQDPDLLMSTLVGAQVLRPHATTKNTRAKQRRRKKTKQPPSKRIKQPQPTTNKRPEPQPQVSEAFGAPTQVQALPVTQPVQETFCSIEVQAQSVTTTNNTRANQPQLTGNKQPHPQLKVSEAFGAPTQVREQPVTQPAQDAFSSIEVRAQSVTTTNNIRAKQPQPTKTKQCPQKRKKQPHPQPKISEAFGAPTQVWAHPVTQLGQEAFSSTEVRAQSVAQSGMAFGAPQVLAQSVMQPGQTFGAHQVQARNVMQPGQAFGSHEVQSQHAMQPGQAFGSHQVQSQHAMQPGQAFGSHQVQSQHAMQPGRAFGAHQVWTQPGHAFSALPQIWAHPRQAFGALPQVRAQPGQLFGAPQGWAHHPGQAFGAQQVRAHPVMQPGQAFDDHPYVWAHPAMQSRQAFGAPPQGCLQPVIYPSDGEPQSIMRRPAKSPRIQWD